MKIKTLMIFAMIFLLLLTCNPYARAQLLDGLGELGPDYVLEQKVIVKTSSYTITRADLGNYFAMNSTTAQTFTLPSVGASEDGKEISIGNIGTGRLTLDASDSDYVDNSGAGDGIYTTSNKASIVLKYCHTATMWRIKNAVGPWVTYD